MLVNVAANDWKTRKIENKYPILLAILGVVKILCGRQDIISSLGGLLCVSIPMLLIDLSRPGAFGGGDIKLMAAGGFFLGMEKLLFAAFTALVMAALYCLWLLLKEKKTRKAEFPLGPFLCAGMVLISIIK